MRRHTEERLDLNVSRGATYANVLREAHKGILREKHQCNLAQQDSAIHVTGFAPEKTMLH